MVTTDPDLLLTAALAYAEAGQPVFPCYPIDVEQDDGRISQIKSPMTRHGFQDATCDPDQITRWWTRTPHAAIGLPTGIRWDVLDVDCKPGSVNGYAALGHLADALSLWDRAVKAVSTPSGGLHVYFPSSPDHPMGNATFPARGIDLRGAGGYVLGPPSLLFSDPRTLLGQYVTDRERDDAEGGPLDHERVRTLIGPRGADRLARDPGKGPARGRGKGRGDLGRLSGWLATQREPGRNVALFWAANRAIEQGHDPEALIGAALSTGLTRAEVDRTICSARNERGTS